MLAGIHRTPVVGHRHRIAAHQLPPEGAVLHALATVGALVALSGRLRRRR